MKPLTKSLTLLVVAAFYFLLYIATKPAGTCDEDCQRIYQLDTTLQSRYRFFYNANRCTYRPNSDTLCIYVRDTTGVNWDRFADTVCMYANSIGLRQQQLFVIRNLNFPPDTVARKRCP
jgi:hypothetical protein